MILRYGKTSHETKQPKLGYFQYSSVKNDTVYLTKIITGNVLLFDISAARNRKQSQNFFPNQKLHLTYFIPQNHLHFI